MKTYITMAVVAILIVLAYHYFGQSMLPAFGKKSVA